MPTEPCPPKLDEQGRSLWEHCRWVIEGGVIDASAALQVQCLHICRELQRESQSNVLQAELDALRFQVTKLAAQCGASLSPCSTGEALSCIKAMLTNLSQERRMLIDACKAALRQIELGRADEVAKSLIEVVGIVTGNM